MNRTEWLACQDPMLMLPAVRERASERKLRLLACACCRHQGERLNAHPLELLEQAEREADRQHGARCLDITTAEGRVVGVLFEESGWNAVRDVLDQTREMLAGGVATWSPFLSERRWQGEIMRDLFDDLFRPPLYLAWVEDHPHVIGLARTIYDECSWAMLPILADALEEAGCIAEDMLEHCREDRPHARGCWVLDAVLGRI